MTWKNASLPHMHLFPSFLTSHPFSPLFCADRGPTGKRGGSDGELEGVGKRWAAVLGRDMGRMVEDEQMREAGRNNKKEMLRSIAAAEQRDMEPIR